MGIDTLDSLQFKERWNQYGKDMIGTCQAGHAEMMMCATECQMQLALYELQADSAGKAQMVMKHVPDRADPKRWLHVLSIVSPTGITYFPTNIPPDFEPMFPADWGEL